MCNRINKAKLIERGWTLISSENRLAKYGYPVDISSHVLANNEFALKFYSKIVQNTDDNVFFSPLSISSAFALLYEGTQGDTAKELQETFGFPENQLERNHGYLAMHKMLNENHKDATLNLSNALWLANNFNPLPDYVNTAQNSMTARLIPSTLLKERDIKKSTSG